MKKRIYFFMAFVFACMVFSCKTKNNLNSIDYFVIYDNFDKVERNIVNGEPRLYHIYNQPIMLVFRIDPENPKYNWYDCYIVGGSSYTGKWSLEADTLTLYPFFEIYDDSIPEITLMDIDSSYYQMQGMLNHKWVIKGDRIYEKEEYLPHDEYDKDGNYLGNFMRPTSDPNNYLIRRSKTKLK